MKKPVKYALLLAAIGLVGYKSIYFEKLSKLKNTNNVRFDPLAYSKKLWEEKLPAKMDSAVTLPQYVAAVQQNKEDAFSKYSNALGIGNYRYSLIKTSGIVTTVNPDEIRISTTVGDSTIEMPIATEFIYGNAIRDASGLIAIEDFPNTADLNSVSEELNKIVRNSVLPEFKKQVKPGDRVELIAAIEINKEHLKWTGLELLPVRIQIVK